MRTISVDTPHGPARAHLELRAGSPAALVLGHGAGGGVSAPDLIAATEAALEEGLSVALVVGGRSLGARVACRTADALDAVAVLCLAFPLRPPRRKTGAEPPSRLPELDAVTVSTLVVQGERDPFGRPPSGAHRTVAVVPGDHSLRTDPQAVTEAVRGWLREIVP